MENGIKLTVLCATTLLTGCDQKPKETHQSFYTVPVSYNPSSSTYNVHTKFYVNESLYCEKVEIVCAGAKDKSGEYNRERRSCSLGVGERLISDVALNLKHQKSLERIHKDLVVSEITEMQDDIQISDIDSEGKRTGNVQFFRVLSKEITPDKSDPSSPICF
jgi:hypothetical protein